MTTLTRGTRSKRQGALIRPLLNFTIAQLKGSEVVSP